MLWADAARLRLPCFPCWPDKKPACKNGFKDATDDPARIKSLFQRHPGATLIGVPTGTTGFDVLDLDTARHPREVHAWLQSNRLPRTRAHQTASGGYHYFFRANPELRCSTGYPVQGIDIRATGGYIIYWPALAYPVLDVPIIEWPQSLIAQFLHKQTKAPSRDSITDVPPPTDAKLGGIVRRVASTREGSRNTILYWAACRLGEWVKAGEIDRTYAERLLLGAAVRCQLDTLSASKTIASGFRMSGA